MKKFCVTFYLFAMALLVFAMSGCGGSSSNKFPSSTTQSAESRRITFTSPALQRNGKYRLYRGDTVRVAGTNARYYLAPVTRGTEDITMNLEFAGAVSQDLPFIITDEQGVNVLFSYNPSGTGTDTATASVIRSAGSQQQLKYTNLTLADSAIDVEVIDIALNADGTGTAGGTSIPAYDYVWHADPQHPAEYWTLGDSTTELDADAYEAAITSTNNGLYIARDIRYTSNTLDFSTSNTAQKDEDTEYVVYYDMTSSAVREAVVKLGETYGTAYSTDKYIFATLPMSNGGMGGNPGNGGTPPDMQSGDRPTPPSSDTRLPVIGADSTANSITSFSTMTHSAADAYANPVLHITEPGNYRISGKWHGQIWIEAGAKSQHQVGIIFNGVEVSCDVAPAVVFYKVYKWAEDNGYDDQSTLAANDLWRTLSSNMLSSDGYYDVGAVVEIADGTTNTFTGANTYRLLELSPKLDDDTDEPKYQASEIGSNISAQQKMYKLDGAFHSRRTMVIGGGDAGTGRLTITSTTCEGLDSEMHMLIDGGVITVSAPDDGINVNEDYVSVFTMNSGTLNVSSTNADGIDSNGWIVINGGTLNISAGSSRQNSAGEAGLDAENGVYISDSATYNWTAAGGTTPDTDPGTTPGTSSDVTPVTPDTPETSKDVTPNTPETSSDVTPDTGTYRIITVTPNQSQAVGDSTFTLFPTASSLKTDTEGVRNIDSESDTFELVHQVNDFAGITVK
ncbi:MAG: carbohydrate-binding domain-containing protein [Synergistaceae bacterium]|nr:carbohydrate-binding domain-containing protein [Synergistaceae bacterium]